ncbi:HAD family hydrolase [Amorphus coralli]|uniref:HAD family hydrolase n=1 Tax=Amorphus coralli TaxID=340680 RepID=UPI0003712D59|nr:HAD family hydrolase [Amorphus coralli]
MPHVRTLVFDLDGTLVETAPDLTAALNTVLALEGLPRADPIRARNAIGHGARAMIKRALEDISEPADDARLDRLLAEFLDYYVAHIADESHPYPGLIDALDRLEKDGWQFAVCTNKRAPLANALLDALDLSRRFRAIAGPDTFGMAKPDPAHLLRTIQAASGDASAAIMVGDSRTDVDTARAAATPVIGVDFGYTDTPMAEIGPDALISHYDEIVDAVERLSAGF